MTPFWNSGGLGGRQHPRGDYPDSVDWVATRGPVGAIVMPRRYTIVRIVLGVLLLAAAVLKLNGLSVSAVPRVGWFAQPWVQLAAVEWEAVLGLWLLSGAHPRGSWLAAVGTFLAFAGVSGYLGWVGVASCGCFGARPVNPWHAFLADAITLVLLAASRPRLASDPHCTFRQGLRHCVRWAGGVLLLLAGLTTVGIGWAGSPAAILARLRGESLSVTHSYLDFGSGRPGEALEATAQVRNWGDRPSRLIGGTSDCSCTAVAELPVTIEPGGSAAIRIRLRVPAGDGGRLTRTVFLRTDYPDQPTVAFRVGCRVE